jgi:thioredoxin 2
MGKARERPIAGLRARRAARVSGSCIGAVYHSGRPQTHTLDFSPSADDPTMGKEEIFGLPPIEQSKESKEGRPPMPDTYLLQCSNCGCENRIPHALARGRKACRDCRAPLIASHALPVSVTDAEWDRIVIGSGVPAVVEVWSPHCAVCSDYEVSVRHLASRLFASARVLRLNIEENPRTAERYEIQGVPMVLLFREGRLIGALSGPQGERGIRERLKV